MNSPYIKTTQNLSCSSLTMVQMYLIQPEKYNGVNFKELFAQMIIKFILLMLHLLIQFIYQPFHQNKF
jgi:hypothetical protein